MSIQLAKPEHEITFQEINNLLKERAEKGVDAVQLLAIACNLVGKLIALQDQRHVTQERALKIVMQNIELGNQQAIDNLRNGKGGTA